MTATPKYLHIAKHNASGRFSTVAECGRLVGRMSLVGAKDATCPKCLQKMDRRAVDFIIRDSQRVRA